MMKNKIKTLISKFKEFYSNPYGMLITMSWLLLIVCLIIKLFGGNWFELGSENSKFIQFCNYVETNKPLKMGIACLINLLSGYISLCPIINVKKLSIKHIIIFFPLMIFKSIISWYNSTISFVLDVIILLVLTTIFNKSFKRTILSFVLITLFQLISLVIRNLSFDFNNSNTVIENYLYQIDYYIMLILFYLYNTKNLIKRRQ